MIRKVIERMHLEPLWDVYSTPLPVSEINACLKRQMSEPETDVDPILV